MEGITMNVVLNLVTAGSLLIGLFFMLIGAVILHRLPDAYNRLHGASICLTLGLTGMLVAACIELGSVAVVSKAVMTVVFTFVATPIGAHLMAKAAHHAHLPEWDQTCGDELAEDKANPDVCTTDTPEYEPDEPRATRAA